MSSVSQIIFNCLCSVADVWSGSSWDLSRLFDPVRSLRSSDDLLALADFLSAIEGPCDVR